MLENLKQILIEQQLEVRDLIKSSQQVEREASKAYLEALETNLIKVITGIRRSGKSYMSVFSLSSEEWVYINFDDERLIDIDKNDLNKIYETALQLRPNIKYWIFDEIQNIEHWDLFINRLQRKKLNIIVTGSNGKILSREISTHLTGRHTTIELFPFSFREYLKFQNINAEDKTTEQIAKIKTHFDSWVLSGAFPETFNLQNKKKYLQELYDRIITRDVLQRYSLRSPKGIKQLAALLIHSVGQEFSYKKATNLLNIGSMNTIKKYVEYLADCYLFFEVEAYTKKTKERHLRPRKIYCIDTGMYNSIQSMLTNNVGRQLENIVYLELRRKQQEIYYIKTPTYEIDFISFDEQKVPSLIQVAYELGSMQTEEREVNALVRAGKDFKITKGLILTLNDDKKILKENMEITVLPVWRWLLQTNA